jgi:hypothetical protein
LRKRRKRRRIKRRGREERREGGGAWGSTVVLSPSLSSLLVKSLDCSPGKVSIKSVVKTLPTPSPPRGGGKDVGKEE